MKNFYLSTPNYGGHVGFISSFSNTENKWLEQRISKFIHETLGIKS